MSASFCSKSGNWYRGSVHNHTLASDGESTALELAEWYQGHGMDFIVITDHDVVADLTGTEELEMLVIPGAEIAVCWEETFGSEILSLGVEKVTRRRVPPQQVIDDVLSQGGIPFLSHPYLSGVSSNLILGLDGLVGIESYNHGVALYWNRGDACSHWDELMSGGRNILGLATEDRHSIDDGKPEAWITVKSRTNTREDILSTIRNGEYYSSTGPEISNIEFDAKGNVRVTCPGAKRININVLPWASWSYYEDKDLKYTPATSPLSGAWLNLGRAGTQQRYEELFQSGNQSNPLTRKKDFQPHVRIEVEDAQGGIAWTNPVPIPS